MYKTHVGLFLFTCIFLLIYSCHENNKLKQIAYIDSVIATFPDSSQNQSSDTIKKIKQAVFNYHLRAFDTIEFGSHENTRGSYYQILDSYFSFIPQENSYYGLYEFSLNHSFNSQDEAIEEIKDISSIIDKKYPTSYIVNKHIHRNDRNALLLLDFKVQNDLKNFSPEEIPKDEGDEFIYKNWKKENVEIEIQYVLNYTWKVLHDINPEKLEFTKKYRVFLIFKDLYLKRLIDKKNKTTHDSLMEESSSKF